jgi:hypothetical protein
MAMLFPGAFWLLGSRFAFLGMERMFPGTPGLVPGNILAPRKGPIVPGNAKMVPGNSSRRVQASCWNPRQVPESQTIPLDRVVLCVGC